MNEFLRKRIERKLESLPDDRVYQVLDFIEFLESRYGAAAAPPPSPLQRLAETVEDTLRAGRVSAGVVSKTMDAMGAAGRVMEGLAAAGKSVVDSVADQARKNPSSPASANPPPPPPPASESG